MTVREQVHRKPEAVQVIIRVFAVKISIDNPIPLGWEKHLTQALHEWEEVVAESASIFAPFAPPTESEIAERLIEGLRTQEVWGKILRGNAS